MLAGAPKRSDEPLRVVFFTASYFVLDGVTLTIRKILEACKLAGHETMVITAAPIADTLGELGELDGENLVLVPGMPVPMENSGTGGHYGYALGLGLPAYARQKLAEFKPHVAHFTVCDLLGMDSVGWARQNNVALVGTWHSNYCDYIKFYSAAWWLTPVLRRYIQQFYGVIPTTYVPTEFMRLKLTDEGYGQFTEMQVWGRGIDLNRFNLKARSEKFRHSCGVRKDSGVGSGGGGGVGSGGGGGDSGSGGGGGLVKAAGPGDDILLIWVGRLVPEKRPDIWLDVFKKLAKEGLPVKGVVVGVGPCQPWFEAVPGITVKGWLSGDGLAQAYASADLLLFPSDVETFGNVTLEALGSGIPAVVEDKCSSHLVSDGVEGFAVHQGIGDPNDKAAYDACVERYADKTRMLVTDHQLRARCSANALLKAATYSNSAVQGRMIENYHSAYRSQIGEFPPSGSVAKAAAAASLVSRGGSSGALSCVGVGSGSSSGGGNGGGVIGNGSSHGNGNGSGDELLAELEDPNDKTPGRRSKRQMVKAACARVLCCSWCSQLACVNYVTSQGRSGLRSDVVHFVWSWIARIVIFVLWLLLGMPQVTSTNLAETNIRHFSEETGLVDVV